MKYTCLERRALEIINKITLDSSERAISHGKLSDYLYRSGAKEDSAGHFLANLCYLMLAGNQQPLDQGLEALYVRLRAGVVGAEEYQLPRLDKLLRMAEFSSLAQYLNSSCHIHCNDLQSRVDRYVEQARQEAREQEVIEQAVSSAMKNAIEGALHGEDFEQHLQEIQLQLLKMKRATPTAVVNAVETIRRHLSWLRDR